MKYTIFKNYLKNNMALNVLLIVSILIIVSRDLSRNSNALFSWNVDTVNYYYNVFENLSIGFIVTLIFYIIVVYYPEEKKRFNVNVKLHRTLARLMNSLQGYIYMTCSAFNVENGEIKNDIIEKYREFNLHDILSKNNNIYEMENNSSYLDNLKISSKGIIKLKEDLLPFLVFMNDKESNAYAEIEDILIFESIDKLNLGPHFECLFFDDFNYIIEAYYSLQKAVGGMKSKLRYLKE